MPKIQQRPLAAPLMADREELSDFTTILQSNLEELFQIAHEHIVRSTAPTANEGKPGDIVPVDDGTTTKLYVRFTSGWKSATFS